MILRQNQQGYLTIVTVILIVIIGFIAVAIAYVFASSAFSTSNFQSANRALYLAESGFEQASRALLLPDISNRSACAGLNISNSMGGGAYTVTAAGPFSSPATPTILSSVLSSSATTIPVASTTGYQSAGRIMIDREFIDYTAINSSNFLNATRGVDGSVAVAHAAGTEVAQYECQLSSSGGEPTLSPANPGDPGGIRNLTENIQLQEAWAVGATSNTFRFNEGTWTNFTNSLSSTNLNSVSMLSYDDGWAVGDRAGGNPYIAHWDGTAWTKLAVSGGSFPNVNLNGIYCIASNNCFAVGNQSGGAYIINWSGISWSRVTPSNSANTNLNAIHCDSATDCWAVGANTGSRFYQWNGTSWAGITNTLSDYPYFGVFCNSSTDCWAVGSGATFARKSGATWTDFATGLPNGPNYNSVYCNNSSDCWVVGNTSGGEMIAHWNGTNWTRFGPYAGIANANLNSVMCANANDCWAVGNNSGGEVIIHWDGVAWSQIGPSASLPNVNLFSVYIISPQNQPWSTWKENFS